MRKLYLILELLLLVAFSVMLVTKYSSDSVKQQVTEEMAEEKGLEDNYPLNDNEKKVSIKKDAFKDFQSFDFANKIQVVSIKENNSSALKKDPKDGMDTTKSVYIEDAETLYIYNDAKLPDANTKMLIMEEYNNYNELLKNDLLSSPKTSYSSKLKYIENENVDNSKRLFTEKDYTLTALKDESVKLEIAGETVIVEKGFSYSFEIVDKEEEVSSEVQIDNYGLLDSSSHIKYEKSQKELDKEEKEIKKIKEEAEKIKENEKKSSEE